MTDLYAVVGNPVSHSLSPQIHAEFARQSGHDIDYVKLLAPLDGFVATMEKFRAGGGKGANVTLPFKLEACGYSNRLSDRAKLARAVNVLVFERGRISGDNTDGVGLVRDLEHNLEFKVAGKRVLLAGAGGAARGALMPLMECKPASLVIVNRTMERARELRKLAAPAGPCEVSDYPGLAGSTFDLVVNATSTGVRGESPPLVEGLFAANSLAYDMMYDYEPTPFLKFARSNGASRVADGLGMLVEQAAESFLIWRGVRPRTAPVIALLKQRAA